MENFKNRQPAWWNDYNRTYETYAINGERVEDQWRDEPTEPSTEWDNLNGQAAWQELGEGNIHYTDAFVANGITR